MKNTTNSPVGALAIDPSCASGAHVRIAQSRARNGPSGVLDTAWVMMELLIHSHTLQPRVNVDAYLWSQTAKSQSYSGIYCAVS